MCNTAVRFDLFNHLSLRFVSEMQCDFAMISLKKASKILMFYMWHIRILALVHENYNVLHLAR